MSGLLLSLYLDGHYAQVITYLKEYAKDKYPNGKLESIRLILRYYDQKGKFKEEVIQHRALAPSGNLWELFFTEGSGTQLVALGEEDNAIAGFLLRIRIK